MIYKNEKGAHMKSMLTVMTSLLFSGLAQAQVICGSFSLVQTYQSPGYSEHSFIFTSGDRSIAAMGETHSIDSQIVAYAKARKIVCVEGTIVPDPIGNTLIVSGF